MKSTWKSAGFGTVDFTVRLGDQMNGFQAEETLTTAAEIMPWLPDAIAHFYPDSTYSQGLDAGFRQRAERLMFTPPRQGARVVCPHCGAPNAAGSLMKQVFAFYCACCGNSVDLPKPKIAAAGGMKGLRRAEDGFRMDARVRLSISNDGTGRPSGMERILRTGSAPQVDSIVALQHE
jgi:hypothetical protein